MANRAAYSRIDGAGAAVQTTYSALSGTGGLTCTLAATTGWPSGSTGQFMCILDEGLSTEEKCSASGLSGFTLTFAARGVDGTSAATHTTGTIRLCQSWEIVNEGNYWVNQLTGAAHAGAGRALVSTGADTLEGVAASTAGKLLLSDGTTWKSTAMSGDVTISGSGVTAIGAAKVTPVMLSGGINTVTVLYNQVFS